MRKERRLKLLFALPGFHRFDRGAEIALLAIAGELANRGHSVVVCGSGEPRADKPYKFMRVPSVNRQRFEHFPSLPAFRDETSWEDATFAASLLISYRPGDYDAVVTCSFPFTHLALRRPSRSKPLQIFVTQNGDWPAFSREAEFRAFRCDGLVCTNPDYLKRNEANWPCALIPNGVRLSAFKAAKPARERFGIPTGVPTVLMVSALIESKRVAEGIRAVAKVPGTHLVVAGDGPMRDDCERLAAELLPGRYSRVTVPPHEMPALYHSADTLLHMSKLESFGNVFLEAMATGLPIVGHDSERLRWIVGHDQFLCDTERPQELTRALRSALKHGRALQGDWIKNFDWPAIGGQYESFIRSLLDGNENSRR